jgi:hypothetical protein
MDTRIIPVRSPQQHLSLDKIQSMTAAPLPFPVSGNIHRQETTKPYHCASFNLDRSESLISRRHSWTSSYGFSAPAMLTPESKNTTLAVRRRRPAALLLRPGATLDMAYFLKNTGPPQPREPSGERRVANKKNTLTLFRKRKDVAASPGGPTWREQSLDSFVPPERVEQKVTLKGK